MPIAYACHPNDEGTEGETEKANARLIAAAPELLEAAWELDSCRNQLLELSRQLPDKGEALFRSMNKLRAAVNKAATLGSRTEGES